MHSHLSEYWTAISQMLEKVAANMSNNLSAMTGTGFASTCFDSVSVPSIALQDYAARIRHYSNCSDSCCVLAFIYIDRALQNSLKSPCNRGKNPTMVLRRTSVHRLFLTAVMLAAKFNDDEYCDNEAYSRIGGISLAELNFSELALLSLLEYNLRVDPQLFFDYTKELEAQYKKCEEKEESKEETKKESKEETADGYQSSGKPIEGVASAASFKTVGSSNEMA